MQKTGRIKSSSKPLFSTIGRRDRIRRKIVDEFTGREVREKHGKAYD